MAKGQQQRAAPAQAVAVQQNQAVANNAFMEELQAYSPNFRDVLPPDITIEFFLRVIITACAQNPDLIYANRRTLFLACVKAATDGLVPDGREGALVVYATDVSQRDPQTGVKNTFKIDAVQWMPMVYGIRKRMRNSGQVLSASAEAVYRHDRFSYQLGDEPYIEHEPAPLDQDRGELIGAYAIIKLTNGEVLRDVLSKKDVEAAHAVSRATNSPMWQKFPGEAYRKTALRRCSKQAPLSAIDRQVLDRDEEAAIPDELVDSVTREHQRQPEPTRPVQPRQSTAPTRQPEFAVVDQDGVEHIFGEPGAAADAIRAALSECRGLQALEGLWESNEAFLDVLMATGHNAIAGSLGQDYQELHEEFRRKAAQRADQPGERLGLAAPTEQAMDTSVKTDSRERVAAGINDDPMAAEREQYLLQQQRERAAEGSQAQGNDPASQRTAESEQRNGAPQSAASAPNEGEQDRNRVIEEDQRENEGPIPGSDEKTGERQSKHIPPVANRGGKQGFDWRVWAMVMFLPKVRKERDSTELALLFGDNQENITACRNPGALDPDDLRTFNAEIEKANREAKVG
jgi:phage RecT family recombinase